MPVVWLGHAGHDDRRTASRRPSLRSAITLKLAPDDDRTYPGLLLTFLVIVAGMVHALADVILLAL